MRRRPFLIGLAVLPLGQRHAIAADWPMVRPDVPLRFPRDHGAHPAFRTEWWYVTGQVRTENARALGFQITFFRSRPGFQEHSLSRFAPKQLLFAHAAIADAAHGRLRHDQRAARAGFGLAEAAEATTDVRIDDWSLVLEGDRYRAHLASHEFGLDLELAASQPVLLQGKGGVSRKGPTPAHASYYYSRPHLTVTGQVSLSSGRSAVRGEAWLDHEWSSEYLAPAAVGWDWTGLNLADGGALMAFRIRDDRGAPLWAGGSHRAASGAIRVFEPEAVRFEPVRWWTSPRTGARYPVAMKVSVPGLEIELEPLMDDQELDARESVGAVYWEGAVRAARAARGLGNGYLELTGYFGKLRL